MGRLGSILLYKEGNFLEFLICTDICVPLSCALYLPLLVQTWRSRKDRATACSLSCVRRTKAEQFHRSCAPAFPRHQQYTLSFSNEPKEGHASATPSTAFVPVYLRYCEDVCVQLQSQDVEKMLNVRIWQTPFQKIYIKRKRHLGKHLHKVSVFSTQTEKSMYKINSCFQIQIL